MPIKDGSFNSWGEGWAKSPKKVVRGNWMYLKERENRSSQGKKKPIHTCDIFGDFRCNFIGDFDGSSRKNYVCGQLLILFVPVAQV